jgi:leader peptidase (prepilin peptidase) / N-methyltransferase
VTAVSALALLVAAVLGLGAGTAAGRAAERFPWARRGDAAVAGPPAPVALAPAPPALGTPVLALLTAGLFVLTALRFGWSAELPAFWVLAAAGVLLAAVDLRFRLLPDRVVLPALGACALLLAAAAAVEGSWPDLLRAVLGSAALFAGYLVLALLAPAGLGMGDVKLAALLGLHLGWLGWGAVVLGAAAGFVVQALAAVVLLATGRVGLRGELPFGPAMLAGAGLAIGWGALLVAA